MPALSFIDILRKGVTMSKVLFCCWALCSCNRDPTVAGQWKPSKSQVEELEKHLVSPAPHDLSQSSRFYFGYKDGQRRVIRGEIMSWNPQEDTKIHITPNFPIVKDGGCGVIHLDYDPESERITSIQCNGDA
jgi:hypothetical protein